MAKRLHKNDSTMDVSVSQLVAEAPASPTARRRISNPANDASTWNQDVVGADAFAPAPSPEVGGRRWMIFAVIGMFAAAAGGYAFVASRGDAPAAVASSVPEPTSSSPAAPPPSAAVAPSPPPTTPAAAAIVAPPADAAVAVVAPAAETAMITADAISSVGAIPPKEKRQAAATKKVVKKKPAAKTKPSAATPKRTNR